MLFFENFYRQNRIKIHTKTHQIAPFKNISREGGMPPKPPNKAHGRRRFAFPNLKKHFLAPLPNPGYAPG